MRRIKHAVASALLAPGALMAQSAVPRYEVARATPPIAVDGELDDAAWSAAAPPVTLQFLWDEQTGAKQRTLVRLLWDEQALYVAYDAEDADITAQYTQRDDPTYRDDALEIFVNPDPRQEAVYYGFEINARGVSKQLGLDEWNMLAAGSSRRTRARRNVPARAARPCSASDRTRYSFAGPARLRPSGSSSPSTPHRARAAGATAPRNSSRD